jgi:putative transposase
MDLQEKLVKRISDTENFNLYAWTVLTNHYHILVKTDLYKIKNVLARLHNGIATQWNREDGMPGRKVWHRFSDRHIRNDDHYWASVNYIHKNPVKHGYATSPAEWTTGSFNIFQETIGKERMSLILESYPVDDMGAGWDD